VRRWGDGRCGSLEVLKLETWEALVKSAALFFEIKQGKLVFTEELKGVASKPKLNYHRRTQKYTENINCEMGLICINYRFNCYFDLIQCICWDSANFP
jgi:hypothetical protein